MPTSFAPFEARVRAMLAEHRQMPASVVAERDGWAGSDRWFRQNVAGLRRECRRIDPADRIVWSPGDAAQCDLWFPPGKIPVEDDTARLLPVLVMTCGYSRFTLSRMIPTRKTEDLLLGMWDLLQQLGRVPRKLIRDKRGRHRGANGSPQGVSVFMGTLASNLVLLPPNDPESKGAGGAA